MRQTAPSLLVEISALSRQVGESHGQARRQPCAAVENRRISRFAMVRTRQLASKLSSGCSLEQPAQARVPRLMSVPQQSAQAQRAKKKRAQRSVNLRAPEIYSYPQQKCATDCATALSPYQRNESHLRPHTHESSSHPTHCPKSQLGCPHQGR